MMLDKSLHHPDESVLYRRAVTGMSEGRRLRFGAVASSRTGLVVLLDLDNMGKVNRRFGTGVGGRLLARIESALQRSVGGRGGAAHLGGDQFLVVVSSTKDPDFVVRNLLTAVKRTHVGL